MPAIVASSHSDGLYASDSMAQCLESGKISLSPTRQPVTGSLQRERRLAGPRLDASRTNAPRACTAPCMVTLPRPIRPLPY